MFTIDPNSFYSRADLAGLLGPEGVDVDTFTARLKTRKVFRQLWRGADILEAYTVAPGLADRGSDDGPDMPKAKNKGNRRRRPGGRPDRGIAAIDARLAELKTREKERLAQ